MSAHRVLLVEWNSESARTRAAELQRLGCEVLVESEDGGRAYRTARQARPDTIVLDLSARPSHSLQTARSLRRQDGLRFIFIGGADRDRERAVDLVPDAIVVASDQLPDLLVG